MIQSRHLRHKGLRLNASYFGELAALGTAALWAFSSILFTIGGRRVGSMIVNRVRLALAVLFVGGMHWLLFGQPFPTATEPYRYAWLALSALIGLVIGDGLLFQCYLLVGPRIGVLLLSMSPSLRHGIGLDFPGGATDAPGIGRDGGGPGRGDVGRLGARQGRGRSRSPTAPTPSASFLASARRFARRPIW